MKAAEFNNVIAESLTTPLSAVTYYARALKEAGLMSTGARGRHAPEMTPLDAARLVLAILTTASPAQCVERVRRFGQIKYSPEYQRNYSWIETIQRHEFDQLFEGETVEEVLAHLFAMPARIGIDAAAAWFNENVFHLRVYDFQVLAELFSWRMEGKKIVAERVVPFKGQVMVRSNDGKYRHVEGFTPIHGGVRTERSMDSVNFFGIGVCLMNDTDK